MADLTFDAQLRLLGESKSEKFHMDTSLAQTIYKGQPVMVDQSVDDVNVVGFVGATVVDPTDVCVGIAAETKTVAADATETTEIEVYVRPSIIGFLSAVFTNADLGKNVYMSDSGTLSETAADNPFIGVLHKVQDGYAYVYLSTPQIASGA